MTYISEMVTQRHSSNNKKRKKRKTYQQKRVKFFNSTPAKRSNKSHVHSVLNFDDSVNDENTWYKNITIPTNVKISGWYIDRVIDYKVKSPNPLLSLTTYKNVFKNPKYGEKNFKIGNNRVLNDDGEIMNNLYPMADRFTDIYNIGYCITGNASGHSHLQPNSWESFWDTRRGKRYDRYVEYREGRNKIKDEYKKREMGIY